MPRLAHAIESYLEYYNATTETPMKLVMFEDAIEHVARICKYFLSLHKIAQHRNKERQCFTLLLTCNDR